MSEEQMSPIWIDIGEELKISQNSPDLCAEFNKLVGVPELDSALAEITRLQFELATANATIERMREAAEWKTIESAPKDGSPVLLHSAEWCNDEVLLGFNNNGIWLSEACNILEDQPTHWMPMPAPPAEEG